MTTKQAKELLNKNDIYFDTLSKNKNSNFVLRRSFFYSNGNSAERIANNMKEKIPSITIIGYHDYWVPFRGGRFCS